MMSLDPDIQQIIAKLDQRIERLQRMKSDLIQEFGQPSTGVHVPTNGSGVTRGNVPRRQVIMQFLQLHGPSSRRDIVAGTGIPDGTVSGVLNGDGFYNQDGKWHVKAKAE